MLLRQWMRVRGYDIVKLARLLGRSWTYAKALHDGTSRPDFAAAIVLREVARIPLGAWVLAAEVKAAKRVAA